MNTQPDDRIPGFDKRPAIAATPLELYVGAGYVFQRDKHEDVPYVLVATVKDRPDIAGLDATGVRTLRDWLTDRLHEMEKAG